MIRLRTWTLVATYVLGLAWETAAAQDAANRFIVGVGRSIHDPPAVMDAMRALGVHSMRIDAPWETIEREPGRYSIPTWLESAVEQARAADIEPLLILVYGNPHYGGDKPRTPASRAAFARYAAFVARHFRGRVRYFDLWNEWNAPTGRTTPGTAEDYVELARHAYPAIKAENADAVVLSGGITSAGLQDGWIERFIELGGLRLVDALSVHPYNYLETGPDAPERAIEAIDRVYELTRAAGRPMQIYVTEMGYPAFDGRGGVTQEVAALYLARFMLLASTRDYVAGVWWYCLRDQGNNDPNDKEHHFGVLDSALLWKPAAQALHAVAALTADVARFGNAGSGVAQRVRAVRANGNALTLEWSADGHDTALLQQLATLVPRSKPPPELRSRRR